MLPGMISGVSIGGTLNIKTPQSVVVVLFVVLLSLLGTVLFKKLWFIYNKEMKGEAPKPVSVAEPPKPVAVPLAEEK
jgi:uncharacterized membrane protein YfcA